MPARAPEDGYPITVWKGFDRMIRKVSPEDIETLVGVLVDAYPGWGVGRDERERLAASIRKVQDGSLERKYYGLFRDEGLVGTMRLFDFRMNLHGRIVDAGGVGLIAVDLLHKKERLAKDLVTYFLQHYRQKKASMGVLYAFRTDFYHQMGFGQGPLMYQYKIPPARFPKGTSKAHIVRLRGDEADKRAVKAYYRTLAARTHGLIEKTDPEVDAMFSSPKHVVWGYEDGEALRGYLWCSFPPENEHNALSNNIYATEFFYDSPEVLAEFCTLIHSQADQFRFVIVNTQDRDFYHLFPDSTNGADVTTHSVYQESGRIGTGLMYRVMDTRKVFEDLDHHDFGGQSGVVRFHVRDSLLPENNTPVTVRFQAGRIVSISEDREGDVEVHVDVSHFSSLVMGVVSFRKLAAYGQVAVSDPHWIEVLSRMFPATEMPRCTTEF